MMNSFEEITQKAKKIKNKINLVAVRPYDESTLIAISEIYKWENTEPVFIGEKEIIRSKIDELGLEDLSKVEIINEKDEFSSAETGVKKAKDPGSILMKGFINTAVFLKAVINEAKNDKKFISHISLMEIPDYKKLLMITDGTVNVFPDLKVKVNIVKNARDLLLSLGYKNPKIAVIGINERISMNNKDLVEGAIISKMNDRGQIKNCIVEGPMPLDTAVNKEAAIKKGIYSSVGGNADIIVCSNLESAANLIKGLVHLGKAKTAGILLGSGYPTVLTSRSDKKDAKITSISIALLNANGGMI